MTEPSEFEAAEINRLTEVIKRMNLEELVARASTLTKELLAVQRALERNGAEVAGLKTHVEAAASAAGRLRKSAVSALRSAEDSDAGCAPLLSRLLDLPPGAATEAPLT
ncbi:hypothetical protein [Microbacterium sp. NPDC090003]|uniref:hypothetical protein n=1 Tax=Microbacterium sp. NPDC090003 TaxID=3364203 RepID=UPI0037FE7172